MYSKGDLQVLCDVGVGASNHRHHRTAWTIPKTHRRDVYSDSHRRCDFEKPITLAAASALLLGLMMAQCAVRDLETNRAVVPVFVRTSIALQL